MGRALLVHEMKTTDEDSIPPGLRLRVLDMRRQKASTSEVGGKVPVIGERQEADAAKVVAQERVLLHPYKASRRGSTQSAPA